KPSSEGAKQNALISAIMGIKWYAEVVNQHVGKRLNLELLANRLERDPVLGISAVCAKACASTLIGSLKYAGFMAPDGTVAIPGSTSVPASGNGQPAKSPAKEQSVA